MAMAPGCAAMKRRLRRNRRSARERWSISTDGLPTICKSQRLRERFMNLAKDDAAALAGRWTEGELLTRDVFSSVERGRFRGESGEVGAVLRLSSQRPRRSQL